MAEYAGYVPTQPVDFGKIGQEFLSNYINLQEKKREEETVARKLALEEKKYTFSQIQSADQKIGNLQQSVGKSFQSVVVGLADSIKDQLYEAKRKVMNGEISLSDYNALAQTTKGSVSGFNDTTKLYNENVKQISKALVDTNIKKDNFSNIVAAQYGESGNFSNKKAVLTPSGDVAWYQVDEKGEMVPNAEPVNMSSLASATPYLQLIQAKDYNKIIDNGVENVAEESFKKNGISYASRKSNPEYNNKKAQVVDLVTGTDLDAGRLLMALQGNKYNTYSTPSQKEELLKQGYKEENLLLTTSGAGGLPTIKLTDPQRAQAKALATTEFDTRIGEKRAETAPRIVMPRDRKPTEAEQTRTGLLEDSEYIFNDFKSGGKMSEGAGTLKQAAASLGNTDVVVKNVVNKKGQPVAGEIAISYTDPKGNEVQRIFRNEFDVFQFLYPGNKAKALTEYNLAREKRGDVIQKRTPQKAQPKAQPKALLD